MAEVHEIIAHYDVTEDQMVLVTVYRRVVEHVKMGDWEKRKAELKAEKANVVDQFHKAIEL